MSARVEPRVCVVPTEYDGGGNATMLVAIYNGNAASKAELINDDGFCIGFDLPWGATIKPASANVLVVSPSGTLRASAFKLVWTPGQPRISIHFLDPPTLFPPGEGFGFQVVFQAPAGPGFGMVSASGSRAAGRLDPIAPSFTPIAFRVALPTEPPGTGVTIGGGSTVTVGGGSTVNTGSGTSVNAGNGSTVVVAPGATVVLPPGTNPAPAPGFPSGPNFLQVAALHWFEASGARRITLSAAPQALLFDGRHVWGLLASGKLVRVEPDTGEHTEIPLAIPAASSNYPLEAFAYDGERFWISGQNGGIVANPDGTVNATTVPSCQPGCILFDGKGMWTAQNQLISRTPTSLTPMSAYPTSFATGFGSTSQLAFDGRFLWMASETGGSGQLTSVDPNSGQVGVQQTLPYAPRALVYDGSSLWLSDATGNAVERRALDGSLMARRTTGFYPCALLFDGANIWVANRYGRSVTKLLAVDNSLVGTFPTDADPIALTFDGINVWSASGVGCSLTRL